MNYIRLLKRHKMKHTYYTNVLFRATKTGYNNLFENYWKMSKLSICLKGSSVLSISNTNKEKYETIGRYALAMRILTTTK